MTISIRDSIKSPAEMIQAWMLDQMATATPSTTSDPQVNSMILPWPVTVGFMPDAPDNAITVYNSTGVVQGRSHRTGRTSIYPGIQIRVRGVDYGIAFTMINNIALALDQIKYWQKELDDGHTYIIKSAARQTILDNGVDQSGRRRSVFTVNANVTVDKLT